MQVQLHIQAVLRGVGKEKTRRQQKKHEPLPIWSHDKNVVPDTSVEQCEQVKRYLTARKEQYWKRPKLLFFCCLIGANSPHPPSFGNQSTLLLFLYCCIFLLCVFRYVYFIQLASQNVKSARLSVYLPELGPLIRKRVLLPLFGSKRGDTLACGGGRGGTQFQRRDRHSGTLCIL